MSKDYKELFKDLVTGPKAAATLIGTGGVTALSSQILSKDFGNAVAISGLGMMSLPAVVMTANLALEGAREAHRAWTDAPRPQI